MKISKERLEQLLAQHTSKKTTIVSFAAKTIPPMRKTKNPYLGRIYKISRVNGIIGIWVYANSVNNQRLRENSVADFEALERCWGKRIPYSPFVEYNGFLYLETKVQKSSSAIYVDGKLASRKQMEHISKFLLRKEGESRRQQLIKEVVLRDYRMDHITHLQLEGQLLEISQT
jgi:hypothetical protein